MNERTLRDRFHALGPLVLRVGIALILLQDGLGRTAAVFRQTPASVVQTGATGSPADVSGPANAAAPLRDTAAIPRNVAVATPEGIRFSADWASVLGIGELGAAAFLLIGLWTRLVALATLAVLGYALFVDLAPVSMPADAPAIWLLAAGFLSLLASGGGSLALRRRRRPDRASQASFAREQPPPTKEFVHRHVPLTQRIRGWFRRRAAERHPEQPTPTRPTRRWSWGRRKLGW